MQFFAPARQRLRPLLADAPPAPRRRHEGAHLRPPRLLRPERPARAQDDRPRPAVHARRPRPAARPGAAPAGRRRLARRQPPPAARARCRCASASCPAPAPRRGTTSTTSWCAAGSGSSSCSPTPGCRARRRRGAVTRAIRALSHHATPPRPRRHRRHPRRRCPQRAGDVRRRADRQGHRRGAGAGAHRPRPRDRPQRRRRGRPHVAEDADGLRRARSCRPSPATSAAVEQRHAAVRRARRRAG